MAVWSFRNGEKATVANWVFCGGKSEAVAADLFFLLRGMMSAFLAVNAALANVQQKALTLSGHGITRVPYLSHVRVRFWNTSD
jgi:hypothetical protein